MWPNNLLRASCCISIMRRSISMTNTVQKNAAVILSGCGVYDGTEIHEASACLVHLSRAGVKVSMFAPNVKQMHVVNHLTGQPDAKDLRNVLEESARIARGNVEDIHKLKSSDYDFVVFPGGFGAAKNLSNYAEFGAGLRVIDEVARVLNEFHKEGKPIGLCCISPVLAARLFKGIEVTVGSDNEEGGKWPYAGTAADINKMGAIHVKKNVTDAHVDSKHLVVTTPAYMCNAPLHDIFDGIGVMVLNLIKMAKQKT